MPEKVPRERLPHLDFIRGLAALAVCAGHLRGFMFVDWTEARDTGLLDRVFYFATGLGHQAVVIFFVLSGFLVGGSSLAAWRSGNWSWQRYLIQRLVRLQTVLLPALLLTLLLDATGRWLTGGAGYDGIYYALLNMGPGPDSPLHIDALTFAGNLAFLQTITVPVYGTNGPVWSLANEFWYYIMFPLALGIGAGSRTMRAISAAMLAALLFWLPSQLVLLGVIWVFGVLVAMGLETPSIRRIFQHWAALAATTAIFASTLVASKYGKWYGSDWMVGAGASLMLLSAATGRAGIDSLYRRLSGAFADMSYTLYLFHFPLLAFLWFRFMAPHQFQPGPAAYTCFVAVLAATVLFAYLMWWCFERNTDSIRRLITTRLLKPTHPA